MMRILGKEGMASPCKGENGGFAAPEVVKAWKMYKELCNLDPFQEGFQTAKAREAASLFPQRHGGVPSPGWRLGPPQFANHRAKYSA